MIIYAPLWPFGQGKVKKPKKPKKPASKGFVAAMLVAAIILGGGAGFGGSMLASYD